MGAADREGRAGQEATLAVLLLPEETTEGQRRRRREVLELAGDRVVLLGTRRSPGVRHEGSDARRLAVQDGCYVDAELGEGVLFEIRDLGAMTIVVDPGATIDVAGVVE